MCIFHEGISELRNIMWKEWEFDFLYIIIGGKVFELITAVIEQMQIAFWKIFFALPYSLIARFGLWYSLSEETAGILQAALSMSFRNWIKLKKRGCSCFSSQICLQNRLWYVRKEQKKPWSWRTDIVSSEERHSKEGRFRDGSAQEGIFIPYWFGQ